MTAQAVDPEQSARDVARGMMALSQRQVQAQGVVVRHATSMARSVQRMASNTVPGIVANNAPFIADLRLMGAMP